MDHRAAKMRALFNFFIKNTLVDETLAKALDVCSKLEIPTETRVRSRRRMAGEGDLYA